MSPLFYEDSLGAKLAEKAQAALTAAREQGEHPEAVELATGDVALVDDPSALAEAELAARRVDPHSDSERMSRDGVTVFGPSKLSGVIDVAGVNARVITMPLDAEGIEYVWHPYPPEEMPGPAAAFQHAADRPFSLLVAPADSTRACEVLKAYPGSKGSLGAVATHDRTPEAARSRRTLAWVLLIVMFGFSFFGALVFMLAEALGLLG